MLRWLLVVSVFAMATQIVAVPNAKNAITIGNFMYFSDTTEAWTRGEAVTHCEEQGGELAKIWNKNLFNQLRLAMRQIGSYWIDGTDRVDPWRFEFNTTCSNYGEYWDLYGLPAENLDLPAYSCLTLNKGKTQATSKIASISCNEEAFVLCQYPLDGCNGGLTEYPTYPTTMAGG